MDEQERTRAEFAAALGRGDARAAAAVYAADARLLPPSAELLEGREEIERFWRAGIESGVCGIELERLRLETHDALALEIGRYAFRLEPADGAAVVDRGKYLLVHRHESDGRWLWAVEMFNPDAPPVLGGRPEARRER